MATNPIILRKAYRQIGSTTTIINLLENIKQAFPDVTILIITMNAYKLKELSNFMLKYKTTVKIQPISSEVRGYRYDISIMLDVPREIEDKHYIRMNELNFVSTYIIIEREHNEGTINVEMYGQ